jgi:hypothetical protein
MGSPRIWAISALNKMVTSPPEGGTINDNSSNEEIAKAEKVWRSWLKSHRRKLQALEPRGPSKLIPTACSYE